MDRYRVGLVIPALNEATSIGSVIEVANRYGTVIVVDDGSTDQTAEIAAAEGAQVVVHAVTQGYDAAINSGFAHAALLGCEVVITLDADGQHDPHLISKFVLMIGRGAQLVVGIRSERQRLAEHLFAWYTKCRFGIEDPLCGMKAYRMSIYNGLGHFDSYCSIGTELMMYAVINGYSLEQVKFNVRDRVGGQSRFGRILLGNYRILRALVVSIIKYPLIKSKCIENRSNL